MRDGIVRDRGHLPALDGLRGIAILLVLGQHAPTRPLIDGFVGVTVFFCLSGYLITTLLLRELEAGYVDLRAFYRRRLARLGPGLLAVVLATAAVVVLARHDLGLGQVAASAGAALSYTTSLFDWSHHPFATGDYFNYTWTLSIEEQFYLLWPLVLIWGYRRNPRLLVALTGLLVATTLTLDLYLGATRAVKYDPHEYFGTDTNALPILVGALLAIIAHQRWVPRALDSLAPAALPALVLLPAVAYLDQTFHPSLVIVSGTALSVLALIGVLVAPSSAVAKVLATEPLRWLGERSYSIYLWNVLARAASINLLGHTLAGDVVWTAMFLVLGEASYRYVERPLRARLRPTGSGRPGPARSAAGSRCPAPQSGTA